MPNDAKLGMVFGVALVILVAVLFFRKDNANPAAAESTPAVVAKGRPAPVPGHSPDAPTPPEVRTPRKHVVQEGDTLAALAERYLGDEARADDLRRANPKLADTEELTPGQELVIPDAAAAEKSAELPQ